MRKLFRVALPILILLAGFGGTVMLVKSKPERPPLAEEEKVWIVSVEEVSPASIAPDLSLFGRIDSPRLARLSAALAADVVTVDVLEGEWASTGQRLVALDERDARLVLAERSAEVQELEAQLENERQRHESERRALGHELELLALARKAAKRAGDLAKSNVGSHSSHDIARQEETRQALAVNRRELAVTEYESRRRQLEARLARARARAEQARVDLDRSAVRAPFSGRIAEVMVSPGDRVRPGDRLLDLYDAAMLEIRAQIPTRKVAVVRDSLDRGLELSAWARVDGRRIEARLERLTSRIARGTGGTDALFRVTSGGERLALDQSVELSLQLPALADSVALPYEALYGLDRVYLLENDRMHGVQVDRLGETRAGDGNRRVIVRSHELVPGSRVIVTQLPNASDGLRVRVASDRQESKDSTG